MKINEIKKVQDIKDIAEQDRYYVLAMFTDCFKICMLNEIAGDFNENKLLEIRIFNEQYECRIFRFNICDEFNVRLIENGKGEGFSTQQYIDYDLTNISQNYIKNKTLINVWNVVDYDKNGHAYIKDWSLTGIEGE